MVWAGAVFASSMACDGARTERDEVTVGQVTCGGPGSSLDSCVGPLVSKTSSDEVAHQIAGRDLARNPPRIIGMRVFPVAGASQFGRLEAQIAEEIPPTLKWIWNDRVNTLHDDGRDGDRQAGDHRYTSFIDLAFAREVGLLPTTTGNLDEAGIEIPVQGAQAAGAEPPTLDGAPLLAAAAATNPDQCVGASCVDPERAFVIRNTKVVNNPSRTSDPCLASPTEKPLVWNFGYLLSKLSSNFSNLAANWLSTWSGDSTVNGQPVSAPQTADGLTLPGVLLQEWADASWPPPALSVSKAPFRLLAIVNRFDLRTNVFFGANFAGELRFVFTPLDFNAPRENPTTTKTCGLMGIPGSPNSAQALDTVILEYGVFLTSQPAIRDWATKWRTLGQTAWGTSAQLTNYLNQLQALTDSVVNKGAGSLLRVRTNEAIISGGPWHMREFTLQNGVLVPATVKQTPDFLNLNGSKVVAQWILANMAAINRRDFIDLRANLPDQFSGLAFLGAESLNVTSSGFGGDERGSAWRPFDSLMDYTNPQVVSARHLFALGTCNGCHGFETMEPNFSGGGEFFAHIMPRRRDEQSKLSSFLTGVRMVDPISSPNKVFVPDPVVPGVTRHFNELVSRNQKMADLLDNRTTAQIAFQPSLAGQ
jgi:hypothetical protein